VELVHEVERQQDVDQLRAAGNHDVTRELLLQLLDLGGVTADDGRGVPLGMLEGR